MPDKKLTDNEIVKALECCSTASCISNKCHYEKLHDIPTCTTKLTKDALDLINRQKAKIIKLENKNSKVRNERNRARAEAYKECIEKVKDEKFKTSVDAYTDAYILGEDDLDNLLKELVGDE